MVNFVILKKTTTKNTQIVIYSQPTKNLERKWEFKNIFWIFVLLI